MAKIRVSILVLFFIMLAFSGCDTYKRNAIITNAECICSNHGGLEYVSISENSDGELRGTNLSCKGDKGNYYNNIYPEDKCNK